MQFNLHNLFKITLLFYTALGMHFITFMPVGSGLYFTPNIVGWLVVALLISLGMFSIYKNKVIKLPKILSWALMGCIFLLIPLLFNDSSFYAFFPRLMAIFGGLFLLFSFYQMSFKGNDKIEILNILLIGVAIQSTLGLLQFFVFRFTSLDFGYYELLNLRPSGVFRQSNVMASFIASGISLSIYLIYKQAELKVNKFVSSLYYYTIFSSVIVLCLLQSKTGFLGLIIALFCLLPLYFNEFKKIKFTIPALLFGIIIGVLALNLFPSVDRGEAAYKDTGIRLDIMAVSVDMIKDSPIIGHGYGTFEKEYRVKHLNNLKENPSLNQPLENLDHPHNEVLYWLTEGGVIALSGLIVLGTGFILIFNRKQKINSMVLISLLAPILIHTQVEYPFYISLIHYVYLIIIIWFIDSSNNVALNYNLPSYNLFKVIGITIPLIALPFFLTGLHTVYNLNKFHHSDYKETKYLLNLNNTIIWQDYIDRLYQSIYLSMGKERTDPNLLKQYLNWGISYVELKPRAKIYDNMIQAIITLEKMGVVVEQDIKSKVYIDAKQMYPSIFKYSIEMG